MTVALDIGPRIVHRFHGYQKTIRGCNMTRSADRIFSDAEWTELAAGLAFSPRQAQVVRCILRALGDKQIARELGISIPTVRFHLSAVFARIGVQDRYELLVHVFSHFRANCRTAGCPRTN